MPWKIAEREVIPFPKKIGNPTSLFRTFNWWDYSCIWNGSFGCKLFCAIRPDVTKSVVRDERSYPISKVTETLNYLFKSSPRHFNGWLLCAKMSIREQTLSMPPWLLETKAWRCKVEEKVLHVVLCILWWFLLFLIFFVSTFARCDSNPALYLRVVYVRAPSSPSFIEVAWLCPLNF